MSEKRREHCSTKNGVRRCEPEGQYKRRKKPSSQKKHRTMPRGRKSRNPSENDKVLNSAFKNMEIKKNKMNFRKQRRSSKMLGKKNLDWTVHKDFALPERKFSSFRFSDINKAKENYGGPKVTIESNVFTKHTETPKNKYSEEDSSSQDYSSSDGTSSDDTSSTSDSSSSDNSSSSDSDPDY
jgi:hypothetical protein